MCGIAGIFTREAQPKERLATDMDRMLHSLRHRGPNDGGYSIGPHVAIGNRRLSIFDLTSAGNQPFFSDDGRYWLVFNGEIYNHLELRRELEPDRGFHSKTDTEALLRALEKWGLTAIDRFIGMFAFALWDRREKRLTVVRDRLGIKPLYYTTHEQRVFFASEIKALLAAGVPAKPDQGTLRDYLVDGRYDHTRRTFFDGIHMLKAGHYLTVDSSGIRETCYWNPAERCAATGLAPHEAATRYWETLEHAVQLRMRADVPYAVMLSGGLDSSALSVLADKHVGSTPLTVCTFRHRESRYDEGPWADLVAKGKPWNRHEVFLSEDHVTRMLGDVLWHQDEPFGGVATFADVLLADAARHKGIYVLLEGQGADETLGGYEYYFAHHLADLAATDESEARRVHAAYAERRGLAPAQWDADLKRLVDIGSGRSGPVGQDGSRLGGAACVAASLLGQPGTGYVERRPFETHFDNALFGDLFATKVPRVLRFKDKSSMMFGVELRVPFLDHRLVELAFSIPPETKLGDGYTKLCLRRHMEAALPREISFHVKRQIQTPQREWLRGALRPMVEEVIHSSSFAGRGIFDVAAVKKTYADSVANPDRYPNTFFVWQWLQIEWWHRIFIDGGWRAHMSWDVSTPNHDRTPVGQVSV